MRKKLLVITLSSILILLLSNISSVYAAGDYDGNDTYHKVIMERIGGSNRYQTANLIADKVSADYSEEVITYHNDTVVIASGTGFADALAGAPLASKLKAPILLSAPTGLTAETLQEVRKLGPTKAYILGGYGAVDASVETQLKSQGVTTIKRLAGPSRYATAVAIAEEMNLLFGGSTYSAFIVSANDYPDALSISPIAGMIDAPILYAPTVGTLDSVTYEYLNSIDGIDTMIIGGPGVIPTSVEDSIRSATGFSPNRIYGKNRYETSAIILDYYSGMFDSNRACIATGTNFPDALSGSVYATMYNAPILLVNDATMMDCINYCVRYYEIAEVTVFGGEGVVSDKTVENLTKIPPLSGAKTEVRHLASFLPRRFAYNNTYSEEVYYRITDFNYTLTPSSGGSNDVTVTIKGDIIYSTLDYEVMLAMDTVLFDKRNLLYDVESSTEFRASEGSTFTTTITFYNIPEDIYEFRIGRTRFTAVG